MYYDSASILNLQYTVPTSTVLQFPRWECCAPSYLFFVPLRSILAATRSRYPVISPTESLVFRGGMEQVNTFPFSSARHGMTGHTTFRS